MNYLRIAVFALASAFVSLSFAQSPPADTNMQIVRDKIKADKKLFVAGNMQLSDAEGKVFWPVYEAYQKDLEKINQRAVKLVASYAEAYNKNAITDEVAKKLTAEMLSVEAAEASLRKNYAGKLDKLVSATKTARYLQIEGKIRAIIHFDLAANIPLVP